MKGAVPSSSEATPTTVGVPVLDVFRGVAAVLMVINHAGFAWLSSVDATQGLGGAFVGMGSFAPVLFFFATGYALGLPGQAERGITADRLWKCVLLVVADQFLYWSRGATGGLDFFGFIALSMLVLYGIGPARRVEWLAAALLAVIAALRFAIGPLLKASIPQTGVLAFLTGVYGQDGISYPLAPWLAYPLAGFLFARMRTRQIAIRNPEILLLGLASIAAGLSLAMYGRGMSFHRWSSMALAFFVLSIAVLAVAWWISTMLDRHAKAAADRIALRGIAAFLVVPVHYALVKAVSVSDLSPMSLWTFALCAMVLAVLSFWLARLGAGWSSRLATGGRGVLILMWVAAVALAAASVTQAHAMPLIAFAAASGGQLVMAALLARRQSMRRPAMPAT
jgi:uncharacterized membrane protein